MTQTVILIGPQQRALAAGLIRSAPKNAVVRISEATRTMDQNALMWALLSDVARAKPEGRVMPSETWKAAFMSALGHEILWQPGIDNSPPFPARVRAVARLPRRLHRHSLARQARRPVPGWSSLQGSR